MAGRIPTNLRMLMILDALGQEDEPRTASEIGRLIGLPKQTTYRLCTTLETEGYLVRDVLGGGFRPGRRARTMASSILHASASYLLRRQVLLRLAETIGETINFVVPEDRGMSYKDRVETNWAFRIQLPVGSHVPFHCTASGKVFLASLSKGMRKRLVGVMDLKAYTEHSHTDPGDLMEELARISRQDYALDNEEFMDGMVAAAVPVRDSSGRYIASLAFHGPVQRISRERAIELVPTLHEAAATMTRELFNGKTAEQAPGAEAGRQ